MKTVSSATLPSSSSSRKSMPSSSRSPTVGLEAEGDGVVPRPARRCREVLEDLDHLGEDRADDLAALEAAEEDRAVEDDVLAQRLGEELEVLRLGGDAERDVARHCFLLVPRWDTRGDAERPLLLSLLHRRWGRRGLRWAGKLNVPIYRATGGPADGQGRQGAGAAADHHRPQVRAAAHGAGRLPGRRRADDRDRLQRRQRQRPRLVAQPQSQPRGRGRGRPQARARCRGAGVAAGCSERRRAVAQVRNDAVRRVRRLRGRAEPGASRVFVLGAR